jgi:hypothetical protein
MWHLWDWINDHSTALNDIGLTWVVPALVVFMAGRLFRGVYHGGAAEMALAAVRIAENRTEDRNKESFTAGSS